MSLQKIHKAVDKHIFHNFIDMNLFQFKRFLRFDLNTKQEANQHIKNRNYTTKSSGKISKIFRRELWKKTFKLFEHKWMFKLHKQLALNFTVFSIYFSSTLQDCFRGRLSIVTNRTSQGFQYCGQHSVFSVYPKFVQLHMTLFAKYEAYFNISTFYSVIDSQIIAGHNTVVSTTKCSALSDISAPTQMKTLLYYLIQVAKINFVVVEVFSRDFGGVIYDGPDIFARVLHFTNGQRKQFASTTYQCVIQVETPNKFELSKSFKYFALQLLTKVNLSLYDAEVLNVSLPSRKYCVLNPCCLNISGPESFQINITVTSMMFKGTGQEFSEYRYGGLVAGEFVSSNYIQGESICTTLSKRNRIGQSFYSHSSSLLLVLYWYEYHSTIDVTVILSQTPCNSVEINDCHFDILCGSSPPKNVSLCDCYLKSKSVCESKYKCQFLFKVIFFPAKQPFCCPTNCSKIQ